MRVRIKSLELGGTTRRFDFKPGLNIVTGPITTGKTSLIRLLRGLLGSPLTDFPQEVREHVSSLVGRILLGDNEYTIARPFVTTTTAKVEIAAPGSTWRLPALQPDATSRLTFGQWLLERLGLPRLQVPSAPTQVDSSPTPVSINDYLMYCELRQDEIDNSVFGHRDHFKNVKRKYVFQIVYGIYNIEMAQLQEELRETQSKIAELRSYTAALERVLARTPWENRAELSRQLEESRDELRQIEQTTVDVTTRAETAESSRVRFELQDCEREEAKLRAGLEDEASSLERLRGLLAQLETQSSRLTRAIVAGQYLLDFEFVRCPRCGARIDEARGSRGSCSLCLQEPQPSLTRDDLVMEQERIEAQMLECRELIESHGERLVEQKNQMVEIRQRRGRLAQELDFLTRSYVSDDASAIAERARKRASLEASVGRFEDYLKLYERSDELALSLVTLEEKRSTLEGEFQVAAGRRTEAESRIQFLERELDQILSTFRAPRFTNAEQIRIDRETYLPIFDGRRFDDLSSQGLEVLVNVAHALAHQRTALALGLILPNVLFIDGLTSNIGHEGEDRARIEGVYDYLMALSGEVGEQLQIIVADHDVPQQAREFVRVEFSEDSRLIPISGNGTSKR